MCWHQYMPLSRLPFPPASTPPSPTPPPHLRHDDDKGHPSMWRSSTRKHVNLCILMGQRELCRGGGGAAEVSPGALYGQHVWLFSLGVDSAQCSARDMSHLGIHVYRPFSGRPPSSCAIGWQIHDILMEIPCIALSPEILPLPLSLHLPLSISLSLYLSKQAIQL